MGRRQCPLSQDKVLSCLLEALGDCRVRNLVPSMLSPLNRHQQIDRLHNLRCATIEQNLLLFRIYNATAASYNGPSNLQLFLYPVAASWKSYSLEERQS